MIQENYNDAQERIFTHLKDKLKACDLKLLTVFSDSYQPHQVPDVSYWKIAEKQVLKELLLECENGFDLQKCISVIEKIKNEKFTYWRIENDSVKTKFTSKGCNPYDRDFEKARLESAVFLDIYFKRQVQILNKIKSSENFNPKLQFHE